jgi:DNA-binding CsgD family transcriptional regulator
MPDRPNGAIDLTPRQREVLNLVSRGKTNFEIATALGITLDGAKWHIREIMAKLGCDSREDDVAAWRRHCSLRERVARVVGPASARGMARAVASVTGAALIAAMGSALLLNRSGGTDGATPATPPAPTQAAATIPSGPAVAPSVTAVAGPIAFRSCGTSSFIRPSIADMASVFHNPRFGGTDQRPGPAYFKYYLTNGYRVVPRANSANVENVALSGIQLNQNQTELIPARKPCDQAFRQDYTIDYYEFWFVGMVPTAVRLDSDMLTITADELPGSFTDFVFPEPPVPAPAIVSKDASSRLPSFKEMRVRDADGRLVYSDGALGEVRYAPDGSLVYASDGFNNGDVEFEIVGHPQTIAIYSTAFPAGSLELTDGNGRVWTSDRTEPAPETWAEVFRRELPAGRYRVRGGGVLIVPVGTPLP